MNNYKFVINDYHAVGDATINLNGITVLAGVNGSGKSTIAKWIYYLIEGTNKFQVFRLSELFYSYDRLARRDRTIIREIQLHIHDINKVDWNNSFKSWYDKFEGYSVDVWSQMSPESLAYDINKLYEDYVESLIESIDEFMSLSTISDFRKERLKNVLMRESNREKVFNIEDYKTSRIQESHFLLNGVLDDFNTQRVDSLTDVLRYELNAKEDFPKNMQFYEDEIAMFHKRKFEKFLNLSNAIYVESPTILEEIEDHNYINATNNIFFSDQSATQSNDIKEIITHIRQLLGGDVIVNTSQEDEEMFKYVRYADNLTLPIANIATGFKALSYMLRLLLSGRMTEQTLLIIDEPEAHLHPQWIVEFANVLVLLHKAIGVKILIATHNPDMVAAMQAIAMKNDVINAITFYQAERKMNSLQYEYKNLGTQISDIFTSFNIAMDRIQDYGMSLL